MKLVRVFLLFLTIWVFSKNNVKAADANYQIEDLSSKLTIQKDYSMLMEMTISVNFTQKSHGINWYIPFPINNRDIKILYITDGTGDLLPYKLEHSSLIEKVVIGDANKTVNGKQIYRLKYLQKGLVKDAGGQIQFLWGTIGNYRDAKIQKMSVDIESPYYKILSIKNQNGVINVGSNRATVDFNSPIQPQDNLTIEIDFEKTNGFQIKDTSQKLLTDKKGILYASLLAAVMILTAVLIRKKN